VSNKTPSSNVVVPAPPALLVCPPPESSETKLFPNGSGTTGASGSGLVLPGEELFSPLEEVASDTHCPTVPRTPVTAFAAAEVLVSTRFVTARVMGCTAAPAAGTIGEEE
jgi:hypothetical protein